MAPQLPDRYRLNVRLGRDEDVEEWLATDTVLDRPVLVRLLAPGADPVRRGQFLTAVRAAATVTHIHLAGVFAVGSGDAATYAVIEWNGGVSLRDRISAGETLPVEEFLPNAAGLAEGLAAMHAAGVVHGAVDIGAVQFSAAHPAKLGAYGRTPRWQDPGRDTAALAAALRTAIIGADMPGLRPSQVAGGLPSTVDAALDEAEAGIRDAASLAAALRATPYRPPQNEAAWTWRWLLPAGLLLTLALLIAAAGLAIDVDPDSPFLFPAVPAPTTVTTTLPGDPPLPPDGSLDAEPAVFDPFGDGAERDGDLRNLVDGDAATSWRTEAYFEALSSVKPGVGVTFRVGGAPSSVQIRGDERTRLDIAWAAEIPTDFAAWEAIASGTLIAPSVTFPLPARAGGIWLVWLTDLPEQSGGEFFASIAEVRFLP